MKAVESQTAAHIKFLFGPEPLALCDVNNVSAQCKVMVFFLMNIIRNKILTAFKTQIHSKRCTKPILGWKSCRTVCVYNLSPVSLCFQRVINWIYLWLYFWKKKTKTSAQQKRNKHHFFGYHHFIYAAIATCARNRCVSHSIAFEYIIYAIIKR